MGKIFKSRNSNGHLDKEAIEARVREVQLAYWDSVVSDTSAKPDPFMVARPGNLINYLGIKFVELEEIKNPFERNAPAEVGGLIDRQQNLIAVATRFGPTFQAFTAAHELGHFELHTETTLHRDIPRNSDSPKLLMPEREANHYGACVLLPRGLLREQFKQRFYDSPLIFNDDTCHHLGGLEAEQLLRPYGLDRELALARARQFGHLRYFPSLCSVFNVSPMTMALRLRELGFVRYP